MNERSPKDGPITIDGVRIMRNHIGIEVNSIPSDDESTCQMHIQWAMGDAFVSMSDSKDFQYLPAMRFRSYAGGPKLPMIAPELSVLPSGFLNTRGKVLEQAVRFPSDRIPSHDPVKIEKGGKEDRFKLKVTDITEDDEINGEWTEFMDIEVLKDGNVYVTLRNTEFESQETMLFKSQKNGGKFPIMAQAFVNVAKSIAKAPRSS